MPERSRPRKGIDPREANLIGYDNPDDPPTGAEPQGDPDSLVSLDSPDDSDVHPPWEGGNRPALGRPPVRRRRGPSPHPRRRRTRRPGRGGLGG